MAQRYDAVIANPPYMGSKGMNKALKSFARNTYPNSKSDLFAIFIEHGFKLLNEYAFNAMVTMQSWMFLSSYKKMREELLRERTIDNMVHMGNGVMKIAFGTSATVFKTFHVAGMKGFFTYIEAGDIIDSGEPLEFPAKNDRLKVMAPDSFKKIPGSPVAYWTSSAIRECFSKNPSFSKFSDTRIGLITGDNDRYIRLWHEVSKDKVGFVSSRVEAEKSKKKWFPQSKGGDFRRWYGNNESVLDWSNDGSELQNRMHDSGTRTLAHNFNLDCIFKKGITWTKISSGKFGARYQSEGFLFNDASANAFPINDDYELILLAFLCSKLPEEMLKAMNPTINFLPGNIGSLPVVKHLFSNHTLSGNSKNLINLSKDDWDSFETSWDFTILPIVSRCGEILPLSTCYERVKFHWQEMIQEMQCLEEENNRLFIDAYGLQNELSSEVPLEEVTLTCNPRYRYGGKKNEEELETMLQCDSMEELVSYAIGCMMGRYSLDKSGLILASQGETIRDYLAQIPEPSFAPDKNAIIPLTDQEWFSDDATNRFRDFVRTVWGEEHLQENLDFVAESLCLHAIKPKKGEAALDTIRRYLSTQFYKDHLRTYKKRPIYWLFSSGKQKAFECLVYLHRYNESTLAEMRTDYVIPLTEKLASYVEKLEQDKEPSASAAEAKRIEKELSKLYKQQAELNAFDEKLRHYADQRISLDLDDGVKVNYGKFGDLLAEVKDVTGVKPK